MPKDTKSANAPQGALELSAAHPKQNQAAFTLVVQSWHTPIAGFLMLVIGLFGGFYGRPLIEGTSSPGALAENEAAGTIPTDTPDPELAAQQAALMGTLNQSTRHFLGSPDAPVTLIEFSDFQ